MSPPKIILSDVNLMPPDHVSVGMETFVKYRKERESYMHHVMLHHRHVRHNPSHVMFVVPWQMHEVKHEKEDAK